MYYYLHTSFLKTSLEPQTESLYNVWEIIFYLFDRKKRQVSNIFYIEFVFFFLFFILRSATPILKGSRKNNLVDF